jgi:magnesium transporter
MARKRKIRQSKVRQTHDTPRPQAEQFLLETDPPSEENSSVSATQNGQDDEDDEIIEFNYTEPGTLPGTLNIPEDALPTELVLIDYDPDVTHTTRLAHPSDCHNAPKPGIVTWLDARGLGERTILQQLGHTFKLHPLVLEDVVNVPHRP